MSFPMTTTWRPEDSSWNVVQDVFEVNVHYGVQKIPQEMCPDRSGKIFPYNNGVQRTPQGMCPDKSRMYVWSIFTLQCQGDSCPDRSRMSSLCIQHLHNGVWMIYHGMYPDKSRMSLHTTTTQWCPEDSSRNVSGQVKDAFSLHTTKQWCSEDSIRNVSGHVQDVFAYHYTMVLRGFHEECVRTCPGCLFIAYNNYTMESRGFF